MATVLVGAATEEVVGERQRIAMRVFLGCSPRRLFQEAGLWR